MRYALILAGGKSSRMGEDKTLLPYKNYPSLTHFVFHKMSEIFCDVKISAKNDKFSPKLPLLLDEFSEFSPLKVIASLDRYYDEPVFVIAADTPFITPKTIKILFDSLGESEISLPSDGEFCHNLCGFYSPKVSQKARKMLENKDEKISNLKKLCPTVMTKFADKKEFLNINTMLEYKSIS